MHSASLFLRRHRRLIAAFLSLMLLPLLFSLLVMWLENGSEALLKAFTGTLEWPPGPNAGTRREVSLTLAGFSALLALLAQLAIHLSTRAWLTRLPAVASHSCRILLAISTALLFRYATGSLMPLVWLPVFGDYLLGIPVSFIAAKASWYVVFPLVVVIFVLAVYRTTDADGNEKAPNRTREAA